jgi:hypothetical protein
VLRGDDPRITNAQFRPNDTSGSNYQTAADGIAFVPLLSEANGLIFSADSA